MRTRALWTLSTDAEDEIGHTEGMCLRRIQSSREGSTVVRAERDAHDSGLRPSPEPSWSESRGRRKILFIGRLDSHLLESVVSQLRPQGMPAFCRLFRPITARQR